MTSSISTYTSVKAALLALVALFALSMFAFAPSAHAMDDSVVVPVPVAGSSLGSVFTLDRLFTGDPLLNSFGTSLGDIFILDQLFGGFGGIGGNSIGSLFTLSSLFGGINGNGILSPSGVTTLGDIIVLDQLF